MYKNATHIFCVHIKEPRERRRIGETGLLSDDNRRDVCFEERGRVYRVHNVRATRIFRYRIDGRVITAGQRCDFGMGVPDDIAFYLIELKGGNLGRAASQILSTLVLMESKLSGFAIHARIILSRIRCPRIRPSAVIALERQLVRLGGSLKQGCVCLSETI